MRNNDVIDASKIPNNIYFNKSLQQRGFVCNKGKFTNFVNAYNIQRGKKNQRRHFATWHLFLKFFLCLTCLTQFDYLYLDLDKSPVQTT